MDVGPIGWIPLGMVKVSIHSYDIRDVSIDMLVETNLK